MVLVMEQLNQDYKDHPWPPLLRIDLTTYAPFLRSMSKGDAYYSQGTVARSSVQACLATKWNDRRAQELKSRCKINGWRSPFLLPDFLEDGSSEALPRKVPWNYNFSGCWYRSPPPVILTRFHTIRFFVFYPFNRSPPNYI